MHRLVGWLAISGSRNNELRHDDESTAFYHFRDHDDHDDHDGRGDHDDRDDSVEREQKQIQ